ncbi:MAG: DUF362 domain-containing protein [Candidatus Hydrogenedentes bacterium]|nr:DUF362 domain-containing protein [Candidatus Hydrogenedentota bacterium]
MRNQSRRSFLKQAAFAGTAAAAAPVAGTAIAQEAASATMSIARWNGAPVAEADVGPMAVKLTEQAIEALGGMGRFVSSGNSVWIKPNMAWDRTPEQAANTNPDVVATLIRLCFDAGAKTVRVGDFTCNEASKTYPRSGIEAAAKAAGAEVMYLDPSRFREYVIGGSRLDKWQVCPEIVESDLVINVPIAKHHSISTVTLAMKNYMGVVDKRNVFHQDIPTCLCDITRFMSPKLCVLDAVRILTAHGPTGGDLADVQRKDTVVASTDIVALDAFGAELLGHDPKDIATVAAGDAAGLGTLDYRSLIPKEIAVA